MPLTFLRAKGHDPRHVAGVDGLRGAACLIVVLFHFWQQSWLNQVIRIGPFAWDFTFISANGYLGVEILFVISGFCLYLPLARGGQLNVGDFFKKRAVRILPSYYLAIIIMGLFAYGEFDGFSQWLWYALRNAAFLNMFQMDLFYSKFNSVFWSLSVEMWFYLLFPVIVIAFRKRPYTISALVFIAAYCYRMAVDQPDMRGFYMNQLPGMIDCFLGGMLAAHIHAHIEKSLTDDSFAGGFACLAALAVAALALLFQYIYVLRYDVGVQPLQLQVRTLLILCVMALLVGLPHAPNWFKRGVDNPIFAFIAGISYNLYLWHAWIALRFKDAHIPPFATETPMDDLAWRAPYYVTISGTAILVAVLLTYAFERPIARLLLKPKSRPAQE